MNIRLEETQLVDGLRVYYSGSPQDLGTVVLDHGEWVILWDRGQTGLSPTVVPDVDEVYVDEKDDGGWFCRPHRAYPVLGQPMDEASLAGNARKSWLAFHRALLAEERWLEAAEAAQSATAAG